MSNYLQLLLGLAITLGLIVLVIFAVGEGFDASVNDYGQGRAQSSSSTSRTYSNWTGDRIAGEFYFGCISKSLFEQLMTYAVQGDNAAFSGALGMALATGDCCKFEDREPIYNMGGGGLFSGLTQVRRPGEYVEYWTVIEAIDPAD